MEAAKTVHKKILAIDDEEATLKLLQCNLPEEGYRVICVASGEKGLKTARLEHPDLIVLDLALRDMNGFSVCEALKSNPYTWHIPIVILTAKSEEKDIVAGLDLGADDYITKPFSVRILLARIKAILRMRKNAYSRENPPITLSDIFIDPDRHEVSIKGIPVALTYSELVVLYLFAAHVNRVFSRNEIIDAIRRGEHGITSRSVDVIITSLRKKLGASGKYIETVRGIGYKLKI